MDIVHFEPWSQAELPDFFLDRLNELSNLPIVASNEKFTIEWGNGFITPTVASLVVQILNHPLPREHTPNAKDSKWDLVMIEESRVTLASPLTQLTLAELNSSFEGLRALVSTLMSRTQKLMLCNCPQLFGCLTRIPELDHFEMNSLFIDESKSSPLFQYARLGDMIRRSTQLTELNLSLPFGEIPQDMFESLSNAIYIQKLRLSESRPRSDQGMLPVLSSLVIDEDGNGVVARLLQNPHSQLEDLDMGYLGLEDRQFIALVHMLPTSKLKYLDVSHNNIQTPGLLEFARELPRIQSLKSINFVPNPGLSYYGHCTAKDEAFVEALVQGVMENNFIEDLESETNVDPSTLEEYPHGSLLMHYLDMNRAGRRILAACPSIPLALWPYVLERAGTRISYTPRHYIFKEEHGRKADAVYFFLQSCPILFRERVDPNERDPTKWRGDSLSFLSLRGPKYYC